MSGVDHYSDGRNRELHFARRASRAFFSAGLEVALALGFLLFSLMALVIVDRQGLSIPLITLEKN